MKLNNTYYILRHGEAVSNVRQIISSWPETFKNPLTGEGKKQVAKSLKKLSNKGVSLIFSSDLLRTKQTASIAAKALNVAPKFDKRLREVGFGDINGKSAEELLYLGFEKDRINKGVKRSETYADVLRRVYEFFRDVNSKYKGKSILIISHQCPLWILENKLDGFSLRDGLKRHPKEKRISRGELRELN